VAEELRRNLTQLELSYLEVEPLHDVDTYEDLASFMARRTALDAPVTNRVVSELLMDGVLSLD